MKGRFITIEGVEGSGKSSQVINLKHDLESTGHVVEVTREPGGTAVGEAIRGILLNAENKAISPTAELLLYAAARAQHIDQRIRPALEAGKIVLCDRFADSTTAYQGAGRALDEATVQALHDITTRGVWPDRTVILDLPVQEGLARATREQGPDRLEQESIEFHKRVREGFLRIAERDPERVRVVDGARPFDEVAADIWALVAPLLTDA